MRIGSWKLQTVSGGTFRLDGGAMFGVVPRPLWEQAQPPDERNRVRMATNCLLATSGERRVLVDTGYGGKLSERERDINASEPGEPLLKSLATLNIRPEQIDAVVLTHLHFDHCGGGTRLHEGRIVPTFPNATYFVQWEEWEDATSGKPEFVASYDTKDFLALEEFKRLQFVDGEAELFPGLSVVRTGCHTRGHQLVRISGERDEALYLADLCPMRAHLRRLWVMAYDLFPLETRRVKPMWLADAAERGSLVMWGHDPDVAAGYLRRDTRGNFTITESLARLS